MPYRFRWVFCQLDALQHCIPPNLRQYLNELPDTLDETYDRILKGINKAQKDNAHRLLQCLTVAVRPLLVKELAELLAFDFQASTEGGIPTLKEDWRWDDEEKAVLSTCSSLITIVPRGDSRVVQFSHFSVKEYLTSSRLARSPHGDISWFRIDLEPSHTIMVQACLATLLWLDEHADTGDAKVSPLVNYAARHWVDHARFEKVSSRLRDGMDNLFDSSKPHFAAWLRVVLKGINKAQKNSAHRLLQCLTVAVRPLLVEEFAEMLAFDFQRSTGGGIPTLNEDWRWDDEEAVLSTCSSLITIVPRGDSRVVQFLHFSVKEYLTSSRLARSPHGDVSQFFIDLEPAHAVMAKACLATLLHLDVHDGNDDAKVSPLVEYAAEHWVDHAQFETVSLHVRDGMDALFDSSKPHFAAWLQVHDMDQYWARFSPDTRDGVGSPLYYAALCGFYDLAERLIMKHPEQVNTRGGRTLFPLPVALYKRRFHVANLLYQHGAVVNVQGMFGYTPLHAASYGGQVDILRWLLNHGADANILSSSRFTPLSVAADGMHFEAIQVLLEHHADINLADISGETPLYLVLSTRSSAEKFVDMVRLLLEHGADPNICKNDHRTPLHVASSLGLLEAARLLLSHGAKVDETDGEGRTPFQLAASEGHDELTKLLAEHGAVPPSQ